MNIIKTINNEFGTKDYINAMPNEQLMEEKVIKNK